MRSLATIALLAVGLLVWPAASVATPGAHIYIPALKVWVGVGDCGRACSFARSQRILSRETMWWPSTPARPGSGGVYAIAGHDVTSVPGFRSNGPFHFLYQMRRGERILLYWRARLYRYRVTRVRVLLASRRDLLGPQRGERLVLSTCWPPYSAVKRVLVYARRY